MDIISFNEASTANGRIESFIKNPDSTSGVVTVPKTIASGETITIPAGRVAVLPNVQIDGVLNVEGDVFIPSGSTVTQEMVTTDSLRTTDLNTTISVNDIAKVSTIESTIAPYNMGTKNKLINGSFQVNQSNYVSGGAVGTDKYGHDGWFKCSDTAGTKATGNSYTFSTVENLTTITIPSGQYAGQIVEGLKLRSGTHTISWTGTASCYINGVLKAKGEQVTVTGGTNVTVIFTNGTLTDVQFEEGSFVTKHERLDIEQDTFICQRYYETGRTLYAPGNYTTGMGIWVSTQYSVPKRGSPTVTATINTGNGVSSPVYGNTGDTKSLLATCVASTGAIGWDFTWISNARL